MHTTLVNAYHSGTQECAVPIPNLPGGKAFVTDGCPPASARFGSILFVDDAKIKEAMNSEMQRLKYMYQMYDTAAFKKIPNDLPTAASALGKASVALGLANTRLLHSTRLPARLGQPGRQADGKSRAILVHIVKASRRPASCLPVSD